MNERLDKMKEVGAKVKEDLAEYNQKNKQRKFEKNKLVCKKCGSENIQVQKIATQVKKKKGLMYYSVGWIVDLMLWIFLTLPRLIIQMFKSDKMVTKTNTVAICQNCGKSWQV